MPYKVWRQGEDWAYAADINTYLQAQVVNTFASSAARSSAIPSPTTGMVSTLTTPPGRIDIYDGSAWRDVRQSPTHGCDLWRSADQTFTSGAAAVVTFDVEQNDTDNYHDNVTNPSRITIPAGLGGLYVISTHLRWDGNSSPNPFFLFLLKQGVVYTRNLAPAGAFVSMQLTHSMLLAAGEYIEIGALQNAGANRNLSRVDYGAGGGSFPEALDARSPVVSCYLVSGPSA